MEAFLKMFSLPTITRAFLLTLMLAIPHSHATSLIPQTLEQLSQKAEIIFYARATKNTTAFDKTSSQVVTYTDFEIIENVKGKAVTTYQIKQIGGQLEGSPYKLVIHGVPEFTVGNEYVLFLPQVSKLGFASPLGLSQGTYEVYTKAQQQMVSRSGISTQQHKAITTNIADQSVQTFIEQIKAYIPE